VTAVAPVLEGYFTDRLSALRASQHTVAAYRDTYRMLLLFAQQRTGKAPSALDLADLDAGLIGRFLDHLEVDRRNSVTSRNLRLTAIQSLFRYAALRCPEHAGLIARVLAIPSKRTDQRLVTFLPRPEVEALLAAPDQSTALGRRDHLLLAVAIHTGLRVSELSALTCADITLGVGAHLRCTGKGRKERTTPLTRSLGRQLGIWLGQRNSRPSDPLFPSRTGGRLATDTIADLLDKHVAVAARSCPSLTGRTITPHTLRHTCAMNLLQAGIDTSSIALWLGHASTRSTQTYLHADITIKQKALALTAPPTAKNKQRFKPSDRLLVFLEGL
jgi:site-specific recombinase XerD